jgi:hypothetical protein
MKQTMKNIVLFVGIFAAALASGCGSFAPSVGKLAEAYSKAIDQHQRDDLLLNILRASNDLPLNFTVIPTLIGRGSLQNTLSVGGLALRAAGNPALADGLVSSRGFDFTLASLDNDKFMRSFMADLSLDRFNVFASSNEIAAQLTFSLLLSDIRIHPAGAREQRFDNAGDEAAFLRFQAQLGGLLDAGLRTELGDEALPFGPVLNKAEAIAVLEKSLGAISDDTRMRRVGRSDSQYQLVRFKKSTRFCLAPAPAGDQTQTRFGAEILCNSLTALTPSTRTGSPPEAAGSRDRLSLNVRSSKEVFRYLGYIARMQTRADAPWLATLRALQGQSAVAVADQAMLVVRRGVPAAGVKVIAAAEHFGEHFYIPLEGSGHSAKVIDFLSVLMAMHKVSGAIPASPGVLLN